MTKRNRVLLILALPITFLSWSIGWILYRIGSMRKSGRSEEISISSDLKFFVSIPEENHVAKDVHFETIKT